MKKTLILCAAISMLTLHIHAQFTLQKNENKIDFSGQITTFYNYNHLLPGLDDHKKDALNLRDAQFTVEGKYKKKYEFKLQLDFANLMTNRNDPETPGFMDAYMLYKGFRFLDVKLGYQKLPFSRGSLVSFAYSPFFHRAEIARGNFFSQRDIGLTLNKKMIGDRLRLFAGIYSGMGEQCLYTPNDKSGKLEYLGRIEFTNDPKLKYREIDMAHAEKFIFSLGLGARYAEKAQYTGNDYMIKTINGKKQTVGFDAFAIYKGLSVTFETDQIKMTPNTPERLMNTNTTYFMAGGWFTQANYYFIKLNSSLSYRYEVSNMNDIIQGITKMYSLGYNYYLKKYDSVIKINYTRLLSQEVVPNVDPQNYNWQMQIGWQFIFN